MPLSTPNISFVCFTDVGNGTDCSTENANLKVNMTQAFSLRHSHALSLNYALIVTDTIL